MTRRWMSEGKDHDVDWRPFHLVEIDHELIPGVGYQDRAICGFVPPVSWRFSRKEVEHPLVQTRRGPKYMFYCQDCIALEVERETRATVPK